jgi:uncharacterized protein YkwD
MSRTAVTLLLVFAVLCAAGPAAPVQPAAAAEMRLLRHDGAAARLINDYRRRHGLGPVSIDATLSRIAADHARDLALSGITGHTGSDGSNPADRAVRNGYPFQMIGENASAGRTELDDVIQAWIRSPTHQANMVLDPATDLGLAHLIAPGTRYGHYWVMMIGSKRHAGTGATGGTRGLGNGFTGGFFGPRRKP